MAFSLTVLLAQVDDILSADNNELSQLARYRHIKAALSQYSEHAPDEITDDLAGDGGKYYAMAGLSTFLEDFSRVLQVEYPAYAISSDNQPQLLDSDDWNADYRDGSNARYLYFPNHTPSATETIRIKHTASHSWEASSQSSSVASTGHGFSVNDYIYQKSGTWKSTESEIATHRVTAVADVDNFTVAILQTDIPPSNFYAFCQLCASLCCESIAVKYSRTSDSTINLDGVDHPSRAQNFRMRAKELFSMYAQHMGIAFGKDGRLISESSHAGTAFVKWDTSPEYPRGRRYLYHGRGAQ